MTGTAQYAAHGCQSAIPSCAGHGAVRSNENKFSSRCVQRSDSMLRFGSILMKYSSGLITLVLAALLLPAQSANAPMLRGFSAESSRVEREWEIKYAAIPEPANMREYMQRLAARPHHVGSPYDKDNAEWILAKLKSWGLDAKIETFEVLFPTPKDRTLELLEPERFKAKLQEPAVPADSTSSQHSEQLPTYNAYSIDGYVSGPLVYVNNGVPEDYVQ